MAPAMAFPPFVAMQHGYPAGPAVARSGLGAGAASDDPWSRGHGYGDRQADRAAAAAPALAGHHGAGACDAHVLAPAGIYPYAEKRPYARRRGTDLAADRRTLQALGIEHAVLVHSNVFNRATTDALVEMAGWQGSPPAAPVSARSSSRIPPGFTKSRHREPSQKS
jgi:hypothetical protein